MLGLPIIDRIFEDPVNGSDMQSQIKEGLEISFGEDELTWEVNTHVLPDEIHTHIDGQRKILQMDWQPIYDDQGEVVRCLLAVRDFTAQKELEEMISMERKQHQDTMEILLQIVSINPSRLSAYFEGTRHRLDLVQTLVSDIKGNHNDIYIALHTVKGNSRVLGFSEIAALTHQAETVLSRYQEDDIQADLADALSKLDELKTLLL